MKGFKGNSFRTEEPPMENAITTVLYGGLQVTAVHVPNDAIHDKQIGYELIELLDGNKAIVAVSEDKLEEIAMMADSTFERGFSIGVFIGQVLTEAVHSLLED